MAAGGLEFNVVLAATAPAPRVGLVYAVTIQQPVQTWTVIRCQDDFRALREALSGVLSNLPPCPPVVPIDGDQDALIDARHELQSWLSSILMYPGARESPALRNFLEYDSNVIPPEYDSLPWILFTENGQVVRPPAAQEPVNDNLHDLTMDEDFYGGDEDVPVQHDESDDDEDFDASQRYNPVDEPVSREDEMDIAEMADVVQMIDDVATVAQELGASHMGRSLMLQEELAGSHAATHQSPQNQNGLQLGSAVSGGGRGGIGNAIEQAGPAVVGAFHRPIPQSRPRLDSFKMIKVIGKGSFGKVFLVREIETGEMFALKVLQKSNIIRRNQVEHTRTERSVLGYVEHPFVVGMRMAFQSSEKLFFVLDFCAGGELFFHLSKLGQFPEPRARFYAAEIALAISYVHNLDIIYRDLKPENVLLDSRGHIRLTDFGLSKEGINSSSSGANSFCGTPEYLAPEILNRQGHGRAVDWWSLGALLYEMLTGLPPFYCQDRERLFERIRRSELNPPAYLTPNAKSVLRGLLTKDPTRRLGSGPNDSTDIKSHPFFSTIDWDGLLRGEITPPWAPPIAGSNDTSQFDNEFTSMPIFSPQSMQPGPLAGAADLFQGFTFQDRQLHGHAAANGL